MQQRTRVIGTSRPRPVALATSQRSTTSSSCKPARRMDSFVAWGLPNRTRPIHAVSEFRFLPGPRGHQLCLSVLWSLSALAQALIFAWNSFLADSTPRGRHPSPDELDRWRSEGAHGPEGRAAHSREPKVPAYAVDVARRRWPRIRPSPRRQTKKYAGDTTASAAKALTNGGRHFSTGGSLCCSGANKGTDGWRT